MTLLFHIWNMALQCVEIYLIDHLRREGRKMCVCITFLPTTQPLDIIQLPFVLKKTAAAVQQFRKMKSTSCTFSPRFLNFEKIKKGSLFPSFCRQLKQAAAYLPTIQSTAVPWHSAHTYKSMEIWSDERHRSYGDSSHISSRSN